MCIFTKYSEGDEMKEDQMDMTYGHNVYGRDEKCIYTFSSKI